MSAIPDLSTADCRRRTLPSGGPTRSRLSTVSPTADHA